MIAKETPTEILLRDAANKEISIPVQNVARRTSVGSLMPAGLLDTLLPEERLDLIRFMAELGKPGEFDAAKGGVARVWKLYLVVSQNQHLGIERVIAGDFTLKDWVPTFSLASGMLSKDVIDVVIPTRNNTRGLFAATQFQSAKGGAAKFAVSGDVVAAWVNGVEVAFGPEFTAQTKPGLNTMVLRIDETKLTTGARLRSGDVTFAVE